MTQETPVWYEPHPVTIERKEELRAQGYRIIDAAFKPEGHEDQAESDNAANAPKRKGRPAKTE